MSRAVAGADQPHRASPETSRPSLLYIRAATAADQESIRAIVHEAGISPLSLNWPNYLLAQDGAEIVGTGQIKPYRDGARELASIAVVPGRQGAGIASAVIRELLRRESGVIWLMCMDPLKPFYQRFGFQVVPGEQLPSGMRRLFRLGTFATAIMRGLGMEDRRLLAMRRLPPEHAQDGD